MFKLVYLSKKQIVMSIFILGKMMKEFIAQNVVVFTTTILNLHSMSIITRIFRVSEKSRFPAFVRNASSGFFTQQPVLRSLRYIRLRRTLSDRRKHHSATGQQGREVRVKAGH